MDDAHGVAGMNEGNAGSRRRTERPQRGATSEARTSRWPRRETRDAQETASPRAAKAQKTQACAALYKFTETANLKNF
jgi:hypothetical protein